MNSKTWSLVALVLVSLSQSACVGCYEAVVECDGVGACFPVGPVSFDAGAADSGKSDGGTHDAGGLDAGALDAGGPYCSTDSQCLKGNICIGRCSLQGTCVPGCHSSAQCPAGQACKVPPADSCGDAVGSCVNAACLDVDGDGYVAACPREGGPVCGTSKTCDCNDNDALIHPGAPKRCLKIGVDSDCNGSADWSEPQCTQCADDCQTCGSVFECTTGKSCTQGQCQVCPSFAPPACIPTQSVVGGGINPATGCQNPPRCVDTPPVCTFDQPQVCGVNGQTYGCKAVAASVGVVVAHSGACLPREGVACASAAIGTKSACGTDGSMYCRDSCPPNATCGPGTMGRCTKVGACVTDLDCPAGLVKPTAPGCASPKVSCINNACAALCPGAP